MDGDQVPVGDELVELDEVGLAALAGLGGVEDEEAVRTAVERWQTEPPSG